MNITHATTSRLAGMVTLVICCVAVAQAPSLPYPVVDTGQADCYSLTTTQSCPAQGDALYGQDSQFSGHQPSYTVSGDGLTVHDNVTDLTWQRSPDTDRNGSIDAADKFTWSELQAYPATLNAENFGGYNDWRLPSIKELYSLIDFRGEDPSGYEGTDTSGLVPFIDTNYFAFGYGDTSAGERIIDAQFASSTLYVSTTMNGNQTLFGVNFADGRIKGYGLTIMGGDKTFYVICVRGNTSYGVNDLADNGDGTITDNATGLMWSQADSGTGLDWKEALTWVQTKNAENYLGHNDWRLPNAKELQGIVDYTRSPSTTGSAAIDPLFSATPITNEAGQADYPCYWTGTTHANYTLMPGPNAVYVAFGRAMGYMNGTWMDVHGAGAQRSDPKVGNPADYPTGHGPQGDAIRIYNYVRLVRDGEPSTVNQEPTVGTLVNTAGAYNGYTLFAPLPATTTYLIDLQGRVVNSWQSTYTPGLAAYLLSDGTLLRTANVSQQAANGFNGGGVAGRIEWYNWDGQLTNAVNYYGPDYITHHDVAPLPNGNVLAIAWERKTGAEATAAGRDPSLLADGELWPDYIVELNAAGAVVWEWHVWDHLVQDYSAAKPNYGVVANVPGKINLNYVGGPQAGADWTHINSVDYNADFDQILLSVHNFGEIWVIDHNTTTQQAAGAAGDLLYRWGNPAAYDAGVKADQQLFGQHDASWIPGGLPGAGDILLFNNGQNREGIGTGYSTVDEIVPPVELSGTYTKSGAAYGPASPVWTYEASPPDAFYASHISGAQRLPNGDTLICEGTAGNFFEVTDGGAIVWQYINPVTQSGTLSQGDTVPQNPDNSYQNEVFRATRYGTDYAAFTGRNLTPGDTLEGTVIENGPKPMFHVVGAIWCEEGKPLRLVATPDSAVGPAAYQWYRNGAPIPGATHDAYLQPVVSHADAGAYNCVITLGADTITTDPVPIYIFPAGSLPATGTWGVMILAAAGIALVIRRICA